MDAATVFRVLSLIPDRTAAMSSGSVCRIAAACKYPERLAFVQQRQHWLSPLDAITKEEQRMLGLHAVHGRPMQESDEEAAEPGEEIHELDEEIAQPDETDLEREEEVAPRPVAEEEPASHAAL